MIELPEMPTLSKEQINKSILDWEKDREAGLTQESSSCLYSLRAQRDLDAINGLRGFVVDLTNRIQEAGDLRTLERDITLYLTDLKDKLVELGEK